MKQTNRTYKPGNRLTDIYRPASLPFIEAVSKRMNVRINTRDEQRLLATYESYWILNDTVASITGEEKRFLSRLARKYQSFIADYLR